MRYVFFYCFIDNNAHISKDSHIAFPKQLRISSKNSYSFDQKDCMFNDCTECANEELCKFTVKFMTFGCWRHTVFLLTAGKHQITKWLKIALMYNLKRLSISLKNLLSLWKSTYSPNGSKAEHTIRLKHA